MKKHRRLLLHITAAVLTLLLIAALLPCFARVVADVELRREAAVKDAVLKAAFQCYAVEGVYPAELEYLERTYGLLINHDRYIVTYDCYAANQPPEVQVLKR